MKKPEANPKGKSKKQMAKIVRQWVQYCSRIEAKDNPKYMKKLKKRHRKREKQFIKDGYTMMAFVNSYRKEISELKKELFQLKGK